MNERADDHPSPQKKHPASRQKLQLLKEACDRHPLTPAYWLDYGSTSFLSGYSAEALYAFRQVLAICPTDMGAITGTMACHLLAAETEEASACYLEHATVWKEEEQCALRKQRNLHQQHLLIRNNDTPWGTVWHLLHTQDSHRCGLHETSSEPNAYPACSQCINTALATNHELYYPMLADMAGMHFGHNRLEEAISSLEAYETACQHYTGSYDEKAEETLSHIVSNICFYNHHKDSILHHIFHLEEDWLSAAETAILEGETETGRNLLNQHLSQRPELDAYALYRSAIAYFESGDVISGCHCFQQAYAQHPALFFRRDTEGRDAATAFEESFSAYFDRLAALQPALYQTLEELRINIEQH